MSSSPITAPPKAPTTTLAKTIAAAGKTADLDHLKYAMAELDVALSCYVEAEAYYDGTKAEEFSHPRIARALRKTKDKYKINFAKTPVNVVADRLRISSVTIKEASDEADEADETEDANAPNPVKKPKNDLTKRFEKEVWKKCGLGRLNRELHQKVSEYGDAYYFVWTETEEEADVEDPTVTKTVSAGRPVIYYNSPKTTRAIYDPEAPDVVLFVIKKWKHFDGQYRINLYYKDRTDHFSLKAGIKPSSEDAGDPNNWESRGSTENPYNRIPIFHFRNAMPYGRPEHADAYGPQDAINKISTTMVHGTEWSGFPQRYGLAKADVELDGGGPGDDWDDESEATRPADTPSSELQGGPGTILDLKGFDSVGTFEVGQPKSFLEPMEFYVRSLAQTTTTPLRYFYPPGAHPPSGESYRAEDTPLINKVLQRQDDYKETHCEVYAFAMEIITGDKAEDFDVDVRWAPAASIDDALGWDTVKKKIEAGVPRRQALIEAGYTADQVDEWLANNNDKAELQRDVEVFSLFAAAAKNLADTGATNGVNPEAVGIVLTHLLQNFAPDGVKLPKWEEKEPELPPNTPPQLVETALGNPQANGQLPKSQPGQQGAPGSPTPRPGTRYTKPPRLDLPPGGVRPERSTIVGQH